MEVRQFEDWRSAIDFFKLRKRDYELVFNSPAGRRLLADLVPFCRGTKSCFHPDPRIHARLEGRREVLLRITEHLNLTPEQLYTIGTGGLQVPDGQPSDGDSQ